MKRTPKTEPKKKAEKSHPFAKFIPQKPRAERDVAPNEEGEKRSRKTYSNKTEGTFSERQKTTFKKSAAPFREKRDENFSERKKTTYTKSESTSHQKRDTNFSEQSKPAFKKSDSPYQSKRSSNSFDDRKKSSFQKPERAAYTNKKDAAFPKKNYDSPAASSALESKIRKRMGKLDEHNARLQEAADKEKVESYRLNRFLAHAGIASRRKADELIAEGRVKVNGEVVREMGYRLSATDKVTFNDKRITPDKKVYILINKPKDCITTTSDERDRRTVLDLVRDAYDQISSLTKPRLFPVGRLDRNTTGVLLITNDGELTQNLTHPSKEIKKIYHVVLDKKVIQEDLERIQHGVVLEDGIAEVNEVVYADDKNKNEVGIQIHSGKNRIVRRIFESLGYEVVKLDRIYFGGLTKKNLARGKWRFLNETEIIRLKHFQI